LKIVEDEEYLSRIFKLSRCILIRLD